MWLLKFHIAFAILCFLCIYGFLIVGAEAIKRNGYKEYGWQPKGNLLSSLFCSAIPILNVIVCIAVICMCFVKKDDLDKYNK